MCFAPQSLKSGYGPGFITRTTYQSVFKLQESSKLLTTIQSPGRISQGFEIMVIGLKCLLR